MFGRQKTEIGPVKVADHRACGAVLLDDREDDERTAGHAPDAVHVPWLTSTRQPAASQAKRC